MPLTATLVSEEQPTKAEFITACKIAFRKHGGTGQPFEVFEHQLVGVTPDHTLT